MRCLARKEHAVNGKNLFLEWKRSHFANELLRDQPEESRVHLVVPQIRGVHVLAMHKFLIENGSFFVSDCDVFF